MNHIELLRDLFYKYDDYQDIRDELRSHAEAGNITEEQYDELMDGYDYFLDEFLNWQDTIYYDIIKLLTPEVLKFFKTIKDQFPGGGNDYYYVLDKIGHWINGELKEGEK